MDYRKLGKRGSGIRTAYRNLSFPLQEDAARHHIRQFPVRAKETEIRVPPGFQPALRYQETVSHIARKERQRAADTYLVRENLPGAEIIPDVESLQSLQRPVFRVNRQSAMTVSGERDAVFGNPRKLLSERHPRLSRAHPS